MTARTNIQQFYRNKNVFLTGGTGFLGKALLEKMLRATEVQRIYLLIRPKGGKDVGERINDLFSDPLFEKLHQMNSQPMQCITTISGDCSLPNLELSSVDHKELVENVDVIIHCAATVRFNETLRNAWNINAAATMSLLELAKEMHHLKAFVHISTLFANSSTLHIEEVSMPKEVEEKFSRFSVMIERHGSQYLDDVSKEEVPFIYCFTKAAAECAVYAAVSQLPVCIVRPCIVTPTYMEPVSGWSDNLNGPLRQLYDFSYGRLHVFQVDINTAALFMPLDYCANAILASAWSTGQNERILATNTSPIFNLGPDDCNIIKWKDCFRMVALEGRKFPLLKMNSYPFFKTTTSDFYFKILNLFYHILPAFLHDLFSRPAPNARSMMKLIYIMNARSALVTYFVNRNMTVSTVNTKKLWTSLTSDDKLLFPFDMKTLNWLDYFAKSLYGLRRFMGKEEPETIPAAVNLLKRLWLRRLIIKCCACTAICGVILLLLYWTVLRNIFI